MKILPEVESLGHVEECGILTPCGDLELLFFRDREYKRVYIISPLIRLNFLARESPQDLTRVSLAHSECGPFSAEVMINIFC